MNISETECDQTGSRLCSQQAVNCAQRADVPIEATKKFDDDSEGSEGSDIFDSSSEETVHKIAAQVVAEQYPQVIDYVEMTVATSFATAEEQIENEELHHEKVSVDVAELIAQDTSTVTQKDLTTNLDEKPQVVIDYEAARVHPNRQQ